MKRRSFATARSAFVGLAALLTFANCEEARPARPPAAAAASATAASPPPTPVTLPTIEGRVDNLVAKMTLDEKIDYLGGLRSLFIRGVPRLGIPEIKMSDGPAGCRHWGPSTAYAAPVGLAAAFDEDLAARVGASMGKDCRARGVGILLGPGMNIARAPLGGRNFEYLGEDPFLAGTTAAAFIRGVQNAGVLATAKHFVANNQEWDRTRVSSEVGERALREIYFPAFERSVRQGQVAAVMTAYNLLNGTYCSQSKYLIRNVLESQWDFQGFVMSDWDAVHDTSGALDGGLDLEMPSAKHLTREAIEPLVAAGRVDVTTIDGHVRRILLTLARAGFLDNPPTSTETHDDLESAAVALEEARRSLVLLKNDGGILPLARDHVQRVAVIGPNADPAVFDGYGSAYVTPFHTVSLLEGIKRAVPNARVDYHMGVHQTSEYALLGRPVFDGPVQQDIFLGRELEGKPVSTMKVDRVNYLPDGEAPKAPVPEVPNENFSIRWTGEVRVKAGGRYLLTANTDDGVRVFVDGKKVIDDWTIHSTKTNARSLPLSPGKHKVIIEYFQGTGGATAQFGMGPEVSQTAYDGAKEVTDLARGADVVVVSLGFGQNGDTNSVATAFPGRWPPQWARQKGLVEAEDSDRPWELPAAELETVRLAAAANPHTIVVVNASGAVGLDTFLDKVPALLWAWYPGQEGGTAVADALFGDVNPSGKLPVTFGKRYEDYPSAPYYSLNEGGKTPYTEGIFVGYRGFEQNRVEPLFPFGYGLSYTKFEYAMTRVERMTQGFVVATAAVKNVGARDGDEIVQFYVAPPKGDVARPPRELRAYRRVSLRAGETKAIQLPIEARGFAYWDEHATPPGWKVAAGTYEVQMGASSEDIRAKQTVEMSERMLPSWPP